MSGSLPTRSRVFLDVQSGSDFLGRITIELFSDKTPKTVENFRAICSPPTFTQPLTYKGSPFHRIIDDFMIQGGDITSGTGTGGMSIYGPTFEDENIGWREIDAAGLVCMANRGRGTNSSQFFITLAPCQHLNAKHTILGHVIKGMDVCERMAKVPVDKGDRPLSEVIISHCGELQPKPRSNEIHSLPSKAGPPKQWTNLDLSPDTADSVIGLCLPAEEATLGSMKTAVAAPLLDLCQDLTIHPNHQCRNAVIADVARLLRAPGLRSDQDRPT
ncbi:MAG: hypothetical protein Q9169_001308 [Polycauliona sp. 2 TL-2023]